MFEASRLHTTTGVTAEPWTPLAMLAKAQHNGRALQKYKEIIGHKSLIKH